MRKKQAIIMYESDEAASRKTITGWVSRDGMWFGDNEHSARWSGCTHQRCTDCNEPIPKGGWRICNSCRSVKERIKFESLEAKEWDGSEPLATYDNDRYFSDEDDVYEYLDEYPDAMLVFCVPQYGPHFEADELLCDYLPDEDHGGSEAPQVVCDAVEKLNQAVKEAGVLSWLPGKIRAIVQQGAVSTVRRSKRIGS